MYMKKINFLILLFIGAFILTSCETPEGALYSGEPNKVSFLGSQINLDMVDGTLKIPIGRTSTEGSFTAPVTLTATGAGYTNVFKISSPVTFAQGDGKTYVNVQYSNLSTIDPSSLSIIPVGYDVNVGLAFPFTLKIDESVVSATNRPSINVVAANALTFKSIGNATIDSSDGWWGEVITRELQKADGVNAYKVVKPFGFNSFAFMINSDNTVTCPNQVIYQHSTYGPVTMAGVVGTYMPENKAVVLEVKGNYTVAAGHFGPGVEIIYLP